MARPDWLPVARWEILRVVKRKDFLFSVLMFFVDSAIENPDAPWVVALSQVPFFSPMLLPTRPAVGGVSSWEIPVAIGLLVVAAYLLRRAAGAAFRIAMLMYGKELTLPELIRWAKQS
jgi:ABC-2 type transport system permease protein